MNLWPMALLGGGVLLLMNSKASANSSGAGSGYGNTGSYTKPGYYTYNTVYRGGYVPGSTYTAGIPTNYLTGATMYISELLTTKIPKKKPPSNVSPNQYVPGSLNKLFHTSPPPGSQAHANPNHYVTPNYVPPYVQVTPPAYLPGYVPPYVQVTPAVNYVPPYVQVTPPVYMPPPAYVPPYVQVTPPAYIPPTPSYSAPAYVYVTPAYSQQSSYSSYSNYSSYSGGNYGGSDYSTGGVCGDWDY